MDTSCSRCGGPMVCTPGDCWCDKQPPLRLLDRRAECYCAPCLSALRLEQEGASASGDEPSTAGITATGRRYR